MTRELKQEIGLRFTEADAISSRIAYILSGKKGNADNILTPYDVYPELFKEEKEAADKKKEEAALAMHKAQMAAFAAKWNNRRRQQGEK